MDNIKKFIQKYYTQTAIMSTLNKMTSKKDKMSENQKLYDQWIKSLRKKMFAKQFRKVIYEIENDIQKYKEYTDNIWECIYLKGRCILKIIEKQLLKYSSEIAKETSKKNFIIHFWFNQMFLVLEQLTLNIRPELNSNIDLENEECLNIVELVVQIHLETIYYLTLLNKCLNNIPQILSYFSMIDNLKFFINYTKHPKTLIIIQKIYLIRINIYIANNDLENSILCQKDCVDLCFRAFFIIADFDQGLNDLQNKRFKYVKKYLVCLFRNLTMVFFLRGVTWEMYGGILKSIESYKQSRYFSNKFLSNINPDFTLVFKYIEKKAYMHYYVFDRLGTLYGRSNNINNEVKLYGYLPSNNMRKNYSCGNVNIQKINKSALLSKTANGEDNFKDNQELTKSIEKMKFPSLEQLGMSPDKKSNKYPKSNFILSTIKTVNLLLSKDLFPVVNNMKKIEVTKLDIDTIEKISKILKLKGNKSKSPDSIKLRSKTPRTDIEATENFNNTYSQRNITNSLSNTNLIFPSKCVTNNISRFQNSFYNVENNNVKKYKFRAQSIGKIEKYLYEPKLFAKTYLRKKEFLDKYSKKETEFLKTLLKNKKEEIQEKPSLISDKQIQNDCEFNFHCRLILANSQENKNSMQKFIESHKQNNIINEKKRRMSIHCRKKINKSIISFNQKNKSGEMNTNNNYYLNQSEIDKNNQKTLELLNHECNVLDQIQSINNPYARARKYNMKYKLLGNFQEIK